MWSAVYTVGSMTRLIRSLGNDAVLARSARGPYAVTICAHETVLIDKDNGKLRWLSPGPQDQKKGDIMAAAVGAGVRVTYSSFQTVYNVIDVNIPKPSHRTCLMDMPPEVLTADELLAVECGWPGSASDLARVLALPDLCAIGDRPFAIKAATIKGDARCVVRLRSGLRDETVYSAVQSAAKSAPSKSVGAVVLALLQDGALPAEHQLASPLFAQAGALEAYETLKEWGWVLVDAP